MTLSPNSLYPFRFCSRRRGTSAVEVIVVLTLIGLVAASAYPSVSEIIGQAAIGGVTEAVVAKVRLCRSRAITENRYVGMRFELLPTGRRVLATYLDGNRNGIRTIDIARGIDRLAGPRFDPAQVTPKARFGILNARVPDPGNPSQMLDPSNSVRLGRSGILSFSPLGASTPGSLYLTDGQSRVAALRIDGSSGRVRTMLYTSASPRWRVR